MKVLQGVVSDDILSSDLTEAPITCENVDIVIAFVLIFIRFVFSLSTYKGFICTVLVFVS